MFGFFEKPSREKFASMLLEKIREADPSTNYVLDLEKFEIKGGSNRGFLQNTYLAYCQTKGEQRKRVLDNFVATMLTKGPDKNLSFEEVKGDLVTVVRERALFSDAELLWQLDGIERKQKHLFESISEWFVRTAVIDAPSHMVLVSEVQVSRWAQLPNEIFSTGLERLRFSKAAAFKETNGVFRSVWNDDYDSSRILVPGIFSDLPLKGNPVVTLPNRCALLVAGSDDLPAIERMLQMAEEIIKKEPRGQNVAPLLVTDEEITDYSVERGSLIFNAVARAKKISALGYYQGQKESLDALYKKNGKDIFVASYKLVQLKDGSYLSSAVWTNGVPTLLPVSDHILFVDPTKPDDQKIAARCSWARVEAVLGDMLLDTKMFPKRFYVSKFPTKEQFDRLKEPAG